MNAMANQRRSDESLLKMLSSALSRSLSYTYIYMCVCVCVCILVLSKLTQIHFNGTLFFNARLTQCVFSVWPVAQPVVGAMEMHSVANLATLQIPLATFFPSKKHLNLVSENHQYCCASARSCSPSARTHLSLSLSLAASAQFLFSERQRSSALIQLNRYYVASLILHASIAEITAQLLSLSYVYLISSDDGAIIMVFCAD